MNVKQYKNYKLYIFIALLLVISLLTACDISKEISIDKPSIESQYENFEKVEVSWVVDGDTIQTVDGRTIRIIGINSPENGKYKEKYGKESTRFAIDTLKNKEVYAFLNNEKKLIKVIDIVDGKLLAKVDNELILINSGEITFHWFKVKFNKK